MRRWLGVALVASALSVTACANDQDPGVDIDSDAPSTTSVTLGECPPGGPDADTPPAGCLDGDGQVVRP